MYYSYDTSNASHIVIFLLSLRPPHLIIFPIQKPTLDISASFPALSFLTHNTHIQHPKWEGETLYFGRYPTEEANDKQKIINTFEMKCKKKEPRPCKEWMIDRLHIKLDDILMKRGLPPTTYSISGQRRPANNIHDTDFNITSKFLKKPSIFNSISGIWLLDRTLGKPSLQPYFSHAHMNKHLATDDIAEKEATEKDVICHINISTTHYKIRSFYLQDTCTSTNSYNVMSVPLGEEIIEQFGSKRTLVISHRLDCVQMKSSMMTMTGYIEYSETKELVSLDDEKKAGRLPQDYEEIPERLLRQTVVIKNHESDDDHEHKLTRYYLSVDP
jgi:hypothetical protein